MQQAYPISEMQRMSSVAERDLSLLRSIFTGALAPSTTKTTETDDELPAAGAPTRGCCAAGMVQRGVRSAPRLSAERWALLATTKSANRLRSAIFTTRTANRHRFPRSPSMPCSIEGPADMHAIWDSQWMKTGRALAPKLGQ